MLLLYDRVHVAVPLRAKKQCKGAYMQLPHFWQHPPMFQIGERIVYLEDGSVEGKGPKAVLTGKELTVLLLLIYQWLSSPRAYMPAWQIARCLYGSSADMPDLHVIETYVHNIRRKLKDDNCINCCRGKGYKLNIPQGCCSVPIQLVRNLLEKSNPTLRVN